MIDDLLLRDFGPDAPLATDALLARSRAELSKHLAADEVHSSRVSNRFSRRTRIGAAVFAVAAACAVLVANGNSHQNVGGSVTLVGYTAPSFPLTLRPVPAGLSLTGFGLEWSGTTWSAAYNDHRSWGDPKGNSMGIVVQPQRPRGRGVLGTERGVTFQGLPAVLTTNFQAASAYEPEFYFVELAWLRKPGQWVTVTGSGAFANEGAVRAVAAHLVDVAQPVPLQVHLAPAGWALDSFKDDTIMTLRNATGRGPDATMSVQLTRDWNAHFVHDVGAKSAEVVAVNDQGADLIRFNDEWIMQARLPDGSAFELQAPSYLTKSQVVAIATGVTHS